MIKGSKILQILPELGSGGVERGTIEVSNAIQQAGGAALVASAGGKMLDDLARTGAQHFQLPLASKNPLTMWNNIQRLITIIKREKVNIIHARSRAPAWSAYYAARATGVPFMTSFHGVYNGYGKGLKHKYNAIMTKGVRTIAVSDFVGEHVAHHYEINPDTIRVIHRGADVEYFAPEKANGMRVMELCKQWNVPEGLPIILLPGRLTRWKGQHVLLEALNHLPHRDFFCVLLGEAGKHPAYVRELEKKVEEYHLQGHVRMVGVSQEMRAAYSAASIILSPAIEPEAFGRVPVEAQAMGKPIIATAHGGAMETVITGEGGTGWLVPPNDSRSLATAIEEALHLSDDDKSYLATHARNHVSTNFSTQAMCAKVLGVYEEVLKEKRLAV